MRIALFAALPLLAPVLLTLAACGPDNGGYDPAPPADAPAPAPAEAAPATPPSAWASDFDLIGTEPFWNLKIRREGLTLTRPDHDPMTQPNAGPTPEGVAAATWASAALAVRLARGECSDGMSDRTYPYAATVTVTEAGAQTVLKGCASPPVDFSEARP